jgi:hypothetical protein
MGSGFMVLAQSFSFHGYAFVCLSFYTCSTRLMANSTKPYNLSLSLLSLSPWCTFLLCHDILAWHPTLMKLTVIFLAFLSTWKKFKINWNLVYYCEQNLGKITFTDKISLKGVFFNIFPLILLKAYYYWCFDIIFQFRLSYKFYLCLVNDEMGTLLGSSSYWEIWCGTKAHGIITFGPHGSTSMQWGRIAWLNWSRVEACGFRVNHMQMAVTLSF